MFTDTLIESSAVPQPRRRWTAMLSLAVQAALVCVLAIIPVLYPGTISGFSVMPLAPLTSPPSVMRVVHSDRNSASPASSPSAPPATVAIRIDPTFAYSNRPPAETAPTGPGSLTISDRAIPGQFLAGSRPPDLPKLAVKPEVPRRALISKLDPGALIHRVQPAYPHQAVIARVQGDVILQAIIDRNGEVTALTLVSGHPLLSKAALDAVSQWRYRPYILNGQTVEVETQIKVHFTLGD